MTKRGLPVSRGVLDPDPELWEALRHGKGLTEILVDFYTRVYEDPRLAPFFEGVTKQRIIEKQYSFLMQIFTGQPVYFGNRPRNAHHWMVISDELYDYREKLMEGCIRRYGLADHLVQRWLAVENAFRKQIVKSAPRPRKWGGVTMPLEGYGKVELVAGGVCDGCGKELPHGTVARYHLRTGKTYCDPCLAALRERETHVARRSESPPAE